MLSAELHWANREASGEASYGRSLYNMHRDYDPQTGSYLEPDPVGLASDPDLEDGSYLVLPTTRVSDPGQFEDGLSAYRYALGDPIQFFDRTGFVPQTPKDSISLRATDLAARGRYRELRQFLSSNEESFSPEEARRLLELCRNNTPAEDLLPGTLKRDLPSDYLDKSLSQIKDLLKHAEGPEREALQKVKKALEQTTRLMDKVGGKPRIR